ncbi:MAG: class I SAM-dependent methyltransferase [Ruminiclostridium sp.]|nr:class I SAM-dependent methyltransferase [Ruminiclostridium sp.]
MNIANEKIDNGKAFDFGRTSSDYAKYRDIYPPEFYDRIIKLGVCTRGQKVLDIGTGTGVLPRNMYKYGAEWTGTDISENQIRQAETLSEGMDIKYYVMPSEELDFPDCSFDVITACQCFFYFDHKKLVPSFSRILRPGGYILVLYMAWLPSEDPIAAASEELVLKYNPDWSGSGEVIHPIYIPECYNDRFETVYQDEYRLNVHFSAESWNGRMKACRGIGASLTDERINAWECEHKKMLADIAPDEFDIRHYAAVALLRHTCRETV